MLKLISQRLLLFLYPLILLLCGCKSPMESQLANEVFKNGHWPSILLKMGHPIPESKLWPMLEENSKQNKRLTVAVIDTGVDYLHPKLMPQMAFKMIEGKPVSAGHDFLGHSPWGHSQMINASWFAFGAQEIQNGRIIGPLENPLTTVDQMNDRLIKQIIDQIEKDPILKNSLFKKISHKNLNLWGVVYLVDFFELDQRQQKLKSYQEYHDKKMLITPLTKKDDEMIQLSFNREKIWPIEGILKTIINDDWSMHTYIGVPLFISQIEGGFSKNQKLLGRIEHFNLFLDLLKKEFALFDQKEHFRQMWKSYLTFQQYRIPASEISDIMDNKRLYRTWHQAFYKTHYGYIDKDPLSDLRFVLCQDSTKNLSPSQFIDSTWERIEKLNSFFIESKNVDNSQRITAQSNRKKIKNYKDEINRWLSKENWEQLNCDENYYDRHQYKEYGEKRFHPYLSERNDDTYHGTHVAGIIVAQHPQIAIYPIRVITHSMEHQFQLETKLRSQYLTEFKEWLRLPLIKAYLSEIHKEDFTALDDDTFNEEIENSADIYFNNNLMDHLFFNDLIQSIDYIHRRQIKVANISLGTNFNKGVDGVDQNDQDKNFHDLNNLLTYEFFKYQTAKAVIEKAPQTLFVVAAGNDGSWIDGKSKSGLPCDLSSPRLQELSSKLNIPYPPNQIKNILCVGSINKKQELSSFTNIVIDGHPFILSYGERILSYINSGDCKGSDQEIITQLGNPPELESLMAEREQGKDFIRYLSLYPKDDTTEEAHLKISQHIEEYNRATHYYFSQLKNSYQFYRCLKNPYKGAYLSGTSMATPAVSGVVAKYLIEEMVRENLSEKEIYNHSDYTPQKIIERLMENATPYKGNGMLKDLKQILNVQMINNKNP